MKNNTNELIPKETYTAPSLRIIATNQEVPFMASILEPIDGGNDEFIDW